MVTVADAYKKSGGKPRWRSWGLVDQFIVSGGMVAISLLVAHGTNLEGFGAFSMSLLVVQLVGNLSVAAIATPFTTLAVGRGDWEFATMAHSARRFQSLICAGLLVCGATAAFLLYQVGRTGEAAWGISISATAAAAAWQQWERRLAFARERMDVACAIDALAAVLSVSSVAGIAWTVGLDPRVALLMHGAALALSGAVGMASFRITPGARAQAHWDYLNATRSLASWFVASAVIYHIAVTGQIYLGAAAAGAAAVASVRAAEILLRPLGVIYSYADARLPVLVARIDRQQGSHDRISFVRRTRFWLAVAASIYTLPLVFFSSDLLRLAFGHEYGEFGLVLKLMCAYYVVMAAGRVSSASLKALGRGRWVLVGQAAALIVVPLAVPGSQRFGSEGIAATLALAALISSGTWALLLRRDNEQSS